jgi:hypothetical protein
VTGEDEHACDKHTCPWGLRKCANNRCIDEELWCNRANDCEDASDERECKSTVRCLSAYTFTLVGVCLQTRRTCSPFEFACTNGVCVTRRFMCDFDDDCGDNSDEMDPSCKQTDCSESSQRFQCTISKT